MPVLSGMHSGYNDNSQIQLQAVMHFVPWLEDALSNGTMMLPYSHSPLISYIDYGCATGSNTAHLFARVKKLLESTRAIGGEGGAEHLQVTLVDLPINDWNQVASTFFKAGKVADGELILPVMVPCNFYAGECAPPGTMHIGTSCDAAQWLQHVPPVSFKDSFLYKDAGEAAEQAFKRQFENDFDHFLRLRAREFAVNGLLFVVMPGSLGSSHVGEGFFTAFNDAALEMCARGEIDSSLLADCMFPIYLPSEDELESISHRSGAWEVLQRGGVALSDLWDQYKSTGDAAGYAKTMRQVFYAVAGPLLQSRLALSEEKAMEMFDRGETLIRQNPSKYMFRNIQVAILLRRVRQRRSLEYSISRRSTDT